MRSEFVDTEHSEEGPFKDKLFHWSCPNCGHRNSTPYVELCPSESAEIDEQYALDQEEFAKLLPFEQDRMASEGHSVPSGGNCLGIPDNAACEKCGQIAWLMDPGELDE